MRAHFEQSLAKVPGSQLVVGTAGLIVGLGIAALFSLALFFFIDLVEALEGVGRNGYGVGGALWRSLLELPGQFYELFPIAVLIVTAMTPMISSHSPKTRPSISIVTPTAPRNGRNDGPGMWTPGGGPSWMTAGSGGADAEISRSYTRIASASQ